MNKRQIKKHKKILEERFNFFNHTMIFSRQCGKSNMLLDIVKACTSKKYKYFKALKKDIQ